MLPGSERKVACANIGTGCVPGWMAVLSLDLLPTLFHFVDHLCSHVNVQAQVPRFIIF